MFDEGKSGSHREATACTPLPFPRSQRTYPGHLAIRQRRTSPDHSDETRRSVPLVGAPPREKTEIMSNNRDSAFGIRHLRASNSGSSNYIHPVPGETSSTAQAQGSQFQSASLKSVFPYLTSPLASSVPSFGGTPTDSPKAPFLQVSYPPGRRSGSNNHSGAREGPNMAEEAFDTDSLPKAFLDVS